MSTSSHKQMPASNVAKRPRQKKMSPLTKVLIGVGIGLLALILICVLLAKALVGSSASGASIAATDYITVSHDDVSNKVRVEGTVQPGRVESVTTHLVTPISTVTVQPGDRVTQGQTIATIDTSAAKSEMETQRTTLDAQVNAAQKAYDSLKSGIDNNTNTEILAALSAQRSAAEQLSTADADVRAKREAAAGADDETAAQLAGEIAAAESAQRIAEGAKSDADAGVNSARQAANTQLETLAAELTTAQTTRDTTLAKLQEDIDAGTITAPINGVVMSAAKPGAPATGPVVTIGDDSKLTITTSVREADIASVKEGNRVTFTSGGSGSKEYQGTVVSVSSIANSATEVANQGAQSEGSGASSASEKPMFTVEIEVTGDREGLYLGGSVKAQIITTEEAETLSVPTDAVYTNDAGTKAVVVAVPGDEGSYTLEERTVEVGLENEVDVAITSGAVSEGDMVLTSGETYRSMVGESVTLDADVEGTGW